MKTITFVAATNNPGKLHEIREILKLVGCDCVSLAEAGLDISVEETGATFLQNAELKARAVYALCGRPVLADDSGLCVDALGGEPGVHTARYAGDDHDSEANIDKLLGNLRDVPPKARSARFISVVYAILADGTAVTGRGWCEGFIGPERRGSGGFGYDPVFWFRGNRSMAELSDNKKNEISHRARAIRKLAFKLRGIKRYRRNA